MHRLICFSFSMFKGIMLDWQREIASLKKY